jgi:phosphoribosylglycinamide formyltransferase-1
MSTHDGRRMKVAFCVSGRGSLFRAAVSQAEAIGIRPVLLVTETKSSTELDAFARDHGVRQVRLDPNPRDAFDRDLARVLQEADADLISLTFDRILPAEIVRAHAGRIINVHPALLPAFAGTHGIERTLESGARFGGATVHEVIDEVDAGPVIAQAVLGTIPGESPDDYGRRMYALLEPMFLTVLGWYADGRVEHDAAGRVVVRGAVYGTLPVNPTLA